jgi:hypothetical protein
MPPLWGLLKELGVLVSNPYDPEKYRHRKQEMVDVYNKLGLDRAITHCVCGGIPLIAFYTFIAEEVPEKREELQKRIDSLKDFYGV